MGIKGLTPFLAQYAPSSVQYFNDLSCTSLRYVAIDVSIFMYKFSYRQGMDVASNAAVCVSKFLNMHSDLNQMGVKVIYVFDGRPVAAKMNVIDRRKAKKKRTQLNNPSSVINVKSIHYRKLKDKLVELGIPFLTSESDGEKACAWLCKSGLVDAVLSDDYDTLAYGCPLLIRDVTTKKGISAISREKVMQELKLTDTTFTDFCILCGCDFSQVKLGPIKALSTIRKDASYLTADIIKVRGIFENVDVPFLLTRSFAPKINTKLAPAIIITYITLHALKYGDEIFCDARG